MPIREHRASDYLKTPEDIVAYLNAAIEDMEDDPRLLLKAFRNVAGAQGGKKNPDKLVLTSRNF